MSAPSSGLGPLTTTFTPPPDCFTEKWVRRNANSTVLNWGATCDSGKRAFASSCYPEGWVGGRADNTELPYQAYSPGLVCPSGYKPTFSVTNTKNSLLTAYVTSLSSDEAATVCCPIGYQFVGGDYCTKGALQLSSREFYAVSKGQCVTTTVPAYAGSLPSMTDAVGVAANHNARLQALPVILVRNTVKDPLPTTSPGGLTTGAKIAIGVCVPVGVIIIAAIAFIWMHRRKKARQAQYNIVESGSMQNPASSAPASESYDGGAFGGKPELDASETMHANMVGKQELDSRNEIGPGVPGAPAELDVQVPPVEMPDQRSPETQMAELPGDIMLGNMGSGEAQKESIKSL